MSTNMSDNPDNEIESPFVYDRCRTCGDEVRSWSDLVYQGPKCERCSICPVCTSRFTAGYKHDDIIEMKCLKCNANVDLVIRDA